MEDATMKKCFICFTTTDKNNTKTFNQSNKVVDNCLSFLSASLADKCSKGNRRNSKNYVSICKKCIHRTEKLTNLQEQQRQLEEKRTQLKERQTQLEEQRKQLQQQLTNVQKEISDLSIAYSLSVLRRRIKKNTGEKSPKSAQPMIENKTPVLPEIISEPTPKVENENNDGIQTADGSDYSNPNNQTVETDDVWGPPPILYPIEPLPPVSDDQGEVDDFLQMPVLYDQRVPERDIGIQDSMPEEQELGVVNHDSTEHQVTKEKVDDLHDVSCGENQKDNLSVGVISVSEKESNVISPKVEPSEVTVEPVVSAKAPRSTDVNKGSPSRNAGSVKSKNIDPVTVQSKEVASVASRPSHSDKVIPGRASFKCNFCEKCFTSSNELQHHEEMYIGTVSHWELKNQHKFPTNRIRRQPKNYGVRFDLNKVYVSKPRDPDEVVSRTFKCGDCHKTFNSPKNLLTHKRVHTGKPIKQYHTGADALRQPLDFTHLGMGFKCSTCKRNFEGHTDFQLHVCFLGGPTRQRPTSSITYKNV